MGKGTQLRYIDRQRLRLSDCVMLLSHSMLEAEEWPSSLFDCASPHSSDFHMFAALDPIFGENPVEHILCPSKWVQLASAVPVRLTNYATVGTSVDDLVLDERQKTQAEHGKKCVASQTFCCHTKGTTSHPTWRQDPKSSMWGFSTSLEKNSLVYNYIQKKHVETFWEVARLVYWAASSWMASKKECPSLSFAST